jgi:hypothetical protein
MSAVTLLATAVSLLSPSLADSAGACDSPGVRLIAGQTSERSMRVRSGKTCGWNFRTTGPTLKNEITQRSAHGTVSVSGTGRITYPGTPEPTVLPMREAA